MFLLILIFSSIRGGSRAAATSKMERFVIIVNGLKPWTVIKKRSLLDVAAAPDPPLSILLIFQQTQTSVQLKIVVGTGISKLYLTYSNWSELYSDNLPYHIDILNLCWRLGNLPITCQCCPHIENGKLICCANQLTGFYMRATVALNGLNLA